MPPLATLLKRKRCATFKPTEGNESGRKGPKQNGGNVDVGRMSRADSSSEESEGGEQNGNRGVRPYDELLHVLKHRKRNADVQGIKMNRVCDGGGLDDAEAQSDEFTGSEDSREDEDFIKLSSSKLGYKAQKSASGGLQTDEDLVLGNRIEDGDDEDGKIDEAPATCPDDYEGPPKGVEDFFQARLDCELTDAEASDLRQQSQAFKKDSNSDYKDVWPSGKLLCSRCTLPEIKETLKAYGVCGRVRQAWEEDKKDQATGSDFVSQEQNALFSLMSSYQDVFFPQRPYPTSYKDADPTLDACVAHCVNHVTRCLDLHKRHLSQIIKLRRSGADVNEADFRDRGFTCPKVLFLAPMRNTGYRIIERILKYAADSRNPRPVQNLDRVIEEFAPDEKLEQVTMEKDKPDDYNGIFGGNVSDTFRVGIQFSRDGLTFFTNFYRSDIVIASPLSLSMMIAGGGLDFLSSIDILVIDRADVLMMQNWQHVITAVGQVNRMPKAQHNVNIMRVREYCLKGQAQLYRQTIVFSSFATAEMNSLLTSSCRNIRGQIRLTMHYQGSLLSKVVPTVKHVFERHGVDGIESHAESRLTFFKDKIVPKLKTSLGTGVLIFAPHYFDYIRLRKLLHQEEIDFSWITEYSNEKHIRKCRSAFFQGECRIMLITERAYFYSRKRIGGIKDIIFYGLPLHAAYYPEIINMIQDASSGLQGTVTSVFCKYSWFQLEGIVGTSRGKKMLTGQMPTYMLC